MSTMPPSGWGPQPDGETYVPPPAGSAGAPGYGPPSPYPPPQPFRPQPPQRRRGSGAWWKVPLGLVLLIVLLGEIGALAKKGAGGAASLVSSAATTSTTVGYRVDSQQATIGTITWGTPHFGTAQVSGTSSPWHHDVPFPGEYDGLGVIVVAQNGPENSSITCSILVDGQEVTENTSSGPYAIVTCTSPN
jgi:hypothetical protein